MPLETRVLVAKCEDMGGGASGFTLVEVLVALLILTVGILGAASMQINSIRGNTSANRISEASLVASDRAEILLNMGFDSTSLVSGSETVKGYGVTWKVVNGAGGADTRDITVKVSWKDDGKTHTFNYRFLKVRTV